MSDSILTEAPDEEYFRYIIGDQCIGDRNELCYEIDRCIIGPSLFSTFQMAQLPEGITELLHHDKLSVPLIICQNIIILNATNVLELEKQWDCSIELTKSSDLLTLLEPYVSKQVTTNLSDSTTVIVAAILWFCQSPQPNRDRSCAYIGHICPQLRLKLLNHYPSSLEFPDLYIGCYRKARYGSVIVSFKGKDQARVESAIKALHKKFQPGAFTEMK